MRYESREPDDTVNVSPIHPLKEAVVLVAGISAVLALIAVVIAFGVDLAIPLIPPDFEAEVFAQLPWGELFDESSEAESPEATELLERLAAQWPECPYRFQLGVLATEEINALAVPGGLILVTEGLLESVGSENELAMVLGHELGHFYHRDHLRSLGRGFVYGLALAAVLGRSSGPSFDLTTLGGDLASRGFDREQEADADRFGLELVNGLYGHVDGSWDFFERVAEKEGAPEAPLAEYLSTHPDLLERSQEVHLIAEQEGWKTVGRLVPWGGGGS